MYKIFARVMPDRFPSGELANQRAMRKILKTETLIFCM